MNNMALEFPELMGKELGKKGTPKELSLEWLYKVMGRSSFKVPKTNLIGKILNPIYNAHTDKGKTQIARDPVLFADFMKGLDYIPFHYRWKWDAGYGNFKNKSAKINNAKQDFLNDIKLHDAMSFEQRYKYIGEVVRQAEDYILTNDLHDMISLDIIYDHVVKNREILTDKVISDIHKKATKIKDDSYLAAKDRDHDHIRNRMDKDDIDDAIEANYVKAGKIVPTKGSAKKDQLQSDLEMRDYKKTLETKAEKELFDYFILGSYNRARKGVKDLPTTSTGAVEQNINLWKKTSGARTSMAKLGFTSESIFTSSIDKFLKKYVELSSEAFENSPEVVKQVLDTAKNLDKKTIKYENEDHPFVETPFKDMKNVKHVGDMENYEGLVKGELPKDEVKIITELAENLHYYHKKESMNLNQVAQWLLEKPLNEMSKHDYTIMNNFFKDLRGGTFLQKFFKEDAPDMKSRFWVQFPRAVTKAMMKHDVIWLKQQGFFTVKGEKVFGTVKRPSWWLEGIQEWIGRMGESTMKWGDELTSKINWELGFYVDNVNNGELLRQFAVRKMEKGIEEAMFGKSNTPNPKNDGLHQMHYKKNYNDLLDTTEMKAALKKEYNLINSEGVREILTGHEIVDKIQNIYKKTNIEMADIIKGDLSQLNKYRALDKKGNPIFFDNQGLEPKYEWRKFVADMSNRYKIGDSIPLNFGIDGLRHIARSMMYEFRQDRINDLEGRLKEIQKKKTMTEEERQEFNDITKWQLPKEKKWLERLDLMQIENFQPMNFERYFPHIFSNRKTSKSYMEKSLLEIEKSNMSPSDKKIQIKKLIYRMNTLEGDWVDSKDDIWRQYDSEAQEILEGRKKKGDIIRWWDSNQRTSNMFVREEHMPDYSIDHSSYEIYQRNVARVYFNQMNQIFTRGMITQFKERAKELGWHKIKFDDGGKFSLLQKWENYLKLYAQDAMGSPSVIPEYILKDPGMKVSGTPYAWWADNVVKKRMQSIRDMLIPDKTKYPHINKLINEIPYSTLNRISNLEA